MSPNETETGRYGKEKYLNKTNATTEMFTQIYEYLEVFSFFQKSFFQLEHNVVPIRRIPIENHKNIEIAQKSKLLKTTSF